MGRLEDKGEIYRGELVDIMPKLAKKRKVLPNIEYIFLQRFGGGKGEEFYRTHSLYSADSIVLPAENDVRNKGKFKICLNSPRIRNLNRDSQLFCGGLILPSYEEVDGIEFYIGEETLRADLSEGKVLKSELWSILLGGCRDVLKAVVEKTFREGGFKEMMGIFIYEKEEYPIERALTVRSLKKKASIHLKGELYGAECCSVGIEPEALSMRNLNEGWARIICENNLYGKNKVGTRREEANLDDSLVNNRELRILGEEYLKLFSDKSGSYKLEEIVRRMGELPHTAQLGIYKSIGSELGRAVKREKFEEAAELKKSQDHFYFHVLEGERVFEKAVKNL